jgi:hypothetical protein
VSMCEGVYGKGGCVWEGWVYMGDKGWRSIERLGVRVARTCDVEEVVLEEEGPVHAEHHPVQHRGRPRPAREAERHSHSRSNARIAESAMGCTAGACAARHAEATHLVNLQSALSVGLLLG